MSAVSIMAQAVTFPRFVSASAAQSQYSSYQSSSSTTTTTTGGQSVTNFNHNNSSGNGNASCVSPYNTYNNSSSSNNSQSVSGLYGSSRGGVVHHDDGHLDFDLLAEYLLDEPQNANLLQTSMLANALYPQSTLAPSHPGPESTPFYVHDVSAGRVSPPDETTANTTLYGRSVATTAVTNTPHHQHPHPHQHHHHPIDLLAASQADPLADATGMDQDLAHVQHLIVSQAAPTGGDTVPRAVYTSIPNRPPLHPHHTQDQAQVQAQGQAPTAQGQGQSQGQSSQVSTETRPAKRGRPSSRSVGLAGGPMVKRGKTQAQIDRRRERNRILARRTRLRKKFFFESLQKEVMDLQKENAGLRHLVATELDEAISAPLLEASRVELPPCIVGESNGLGGAVGPDGANPNGATMDRRDVGLVRSLRTSQSCFVITDPSLRDNPIVYASEGFLVVTGYGRDEVLGRNCRFLQGPDTCPEKVATLRKGIDRGEDVSLCLLNYMADGTKFWNQLFVAALRDTQNNIVNFIGVTVKVAAPGPEDPEHAKATADNEHESGTGTTAADEDNDNGDELLALGGDLKEDADEDDDDAMDKDTEGLAGTDEDDNVTKTT